MTVRRTSNYTAHFDTPEAAEAFAARLPVAVTDHGHMGITYRATDDDHARAIAAFTGIGVPLAAGYTLSTGLGVHRREVQA